MTTETPTQLRKTAEAFAIKAYQQMPNHRLYALPPQARVLLGALARAMLQRRQADGRTDMDGKQPSAHQEFFGIVEALAKAGVNILQARPSDPPALPALWTNPLTGQPLPAPKGMTERSLLQKTDPQLLEMFDALEKEPYRVVQQMREAEAKRAAMKAIEYNAFTHEVNPFRGTDESAKAELFKRDPLLASFCQREAKPVSLDLFGVKRDLTVRGKIFKDPAAAAIVELAEKIDLQWRMDDRRQAAEAKAEAEKRLAELNVSETPQPARIAQRVRLGAE